MLGLHPLEIAHDVRTQENVFETGGRRVGADAGEVFEKPNHEIAAEHHVIH